MASGASLLWHLLIILVPVFAFPLIAALAIQLRKYISHRHELEFKRDMVECGLSIDEIERVVSAKSSPKIK